MGRKKLEMRARETREGKQVTFSKRRMGLEKKAQQLSTLCDIPLLLLLFSPGHRLSWISGSHGTPEELLMRYADIPFEERNRRKIEVLEQLNRAFRKSNHEVNLEEFSWQTSSTSSIKDLLTSQRYKSNILQKLREYEMPKTTEHASQMEEILRIRLQQIQMQRPLLESNQCIAPYNQTLVEEQPLLASSQCIVSYNETSGQQRCSEDSTNCAIDVTSQDAWEANYVPSVFEQDSIPLLAHQGVPDIASSCLPSSSILSDNFLSDTLNQFGNQPMCVCHLPTCLDNMCNRKGDVWHENTIFESYDSLLSVGKDNSFLDGSLLGDGDLCSSTNVHYTRPYHFEPFYEYEDIKPLNLQALNNFLQG